MRTPKSAFISYSTDASNKAKAVSKYLEGLHIGSFVFEKDLKKDKGSHQASIRLKIEECDSMILILSAKSKDSPWVSHELGIASGLNKDIYVFKTAHNLRLPEYLDSYQLTMLETINDLDNHFLNKGDKK